MSDNAVSGDPAENQVHPDTGASTSNLPNTPTPQAILTDTSDIITALEQDVDTLDQFDPATLANLAALSRIGGDEEIEIDPELEDDGWNEKQGLTREQVQEIMANLLAARQREKPDDEEDGEGEGREDVEGGERGARDGTGEEKFGEEDLLRDREEEGQGRSGSDDDYDEPTFAFGDKKMKRKRNRTLLSCTECHRRCDRKIPCNRCIRRGVPSMCRLDISVVPKKRKKKLVNDIPINYELGLRVQALESLIRSGSNMDAEAASSAAMETVLHATRAAHSGSMDASNALAQLTQSDIGGLTQDAQSSLLMDVLQQLQVASMGTTTSTTGNAPISSDDDIWSTVPTAPAETTAIIATACEIDPSETKLNLSLPGFREDNGHIFIPPTVRFVEKNMRNENILARETPVEGDEDFLDQAIKFAYGGESQAYKDKRISAVQAISLSGGLRLAGTFLSRFPALTSTSPKIVYIPDPTIQEDMVALRDAGLEVRYFRFVDRRSGTVDWEGLKEDLEAAPTGSIVMLHVSGTTPTGVELSPTQWKLLTTLLQEQKHIPLLLMAFQGLCSGNVDRDAHPLRSMVQVGLPVVLVQSFDAMMGLYSDSPATVSVYTRSSDTRDRVDSQLRHVARGMYLHPSPWGAHIVYTILSDGKLYPAWLAEIKAMADRLRSVREKLFDVIVNKLKTPGSWSHIRRAAGLYCTSLLSPGLVENLAIHRQVYLLPSGSFSLGCLNATKIETLARAIDHVVREGIREAEEAESQRIAMEIALAAAREAAAREEAEAQAVREAEEADLAREEDTLLMERSIANAIEAQKIAEEEDKRREEDQGRLEEAVRKAAERAEIARQAEAILASIQG